MVTTLPRDRIAAVPGLSDQRPVRLHADQSSDAFTHERMVVDREYPDG